MSFQRVILTPKQLRTYKPIFPPLNPHPLQSTLELTKASPHVEPAFAFAVAVDMMGLDLALMFVKSTTAVLNAWIHLMEAHGWSDDLHHSDLQMELILNAVKLASIVEGENRLQREARAFNLINQITLNNEELKQALTQSLLLNKALDVPWTVRLALPPKGSRDFFGTWTSQ